VDLLVMGTVRSAGAGCTCPANALIRELLRHLLVERDEAVVMDIEAGIEHMGRGTAKHMDTMLIVVDPSLRSMETAKKIYGLAMEAGIKKASMLGNRIADASQGKLIKQFAANNDIPLLGLIPYDEKILKADIKGETPLKFAKYSEGIVAIQKIGENLLGQEI